MRVLLILSQMLKNKFLIFMVVKTGVIMSKNAVGRTMLLTLYIHRYIRVYMYKHVCVCIHTRMCICIYVCRVVFDAVSVTMTRT